MPISFLKIKYRILEIWNHSGFQKYFRNTGWMFFGQMFSLVVSFFIGAWLARYLGPGNFGTLSYAIAFAGLFSFFADFGIGGILNRELVKFPEKRDELLGTGFRLKLIGGTATFFLVCFVTLLLKNNFISRFLIISFAFTFILQSINVINTFFYAKVESKKNVRVVMIATFISSLFKILVILLGKGIIWIMAIYVLDSLWQGIGFFITYRKQGFKVKDWRFDKILAFEILKNSWPLMLAAVAGFIYLKIDQVMIGQMLGNFEVGLYAAAVKLVEIWYFVPAIICGSLFPAIVNAKKTDYNTYKKRLKALYFLMVGVAVVIAIPSTILAPWIVSVIFGQEYMAAVIILQIYVWSGVGLFLSTAITQYFLAENFVLTIFYYNLFSMLTNVILNLILIPRLGLSGAAFATLISYSIGPVLFITNKLIKK